MDDLTDLPHIASPLLYLFNGELVRISAFIKENKGTMAYGYLYGLRTHSESPVVHFATLKTKPKQDRSHIAKASSNDYSLDLVGEWYSFEYMTCTLREFLRRRLFQLAENETKFVVMVSEKEPPTDTVSPLCLGTFFLVAKAGVICKVDKKILNKESPFRYDANLATELESIEYQSTDHHDQAADDVGERKLNEFGQILNGTRETDTAIEMTPLEQANCFTDVGRHCTGSLKEVKVKVNDGANDGNTNLSNGLDANLSSQHVPESQYGSSNDQNTSNLDNGSGTEKIEGKEDDMTLLEQANSNGGLEEVKVNDGALDTNLSNGPDATQHVPESQHGPSNDKNTSNCFDNGIGTEKIEGKEDDKTEDMISNDLQAQSGMIDGTPLDGTPLDGTQTRQTSDFKEKPEDEWPNKDDEFRDEDRETSETHRGSETEQEPRDVNGGTGQKIKPNGIGTEVETPDCRKSERNSVPQSADDGEKIGASSNGISSRCDDAEDASKDVARNECQPIKDETDKQTAETQKGFETERSAHNINHETEEPKPTSTEVRAKPMEENVLGQPLKKDQRSDSPKLDDLVAADNSGETRSDDEDPDDSTVSSHSAEGDQSDDPDIVNSPDQICSDPSINNSARTTSTLSQTNDQPKIELTEMITEKIKDSIPFDCKNVGSREVEITLEFQSTKYQLTCEKREGGTFRETTVILKVGHEQFVETEIDDSIEKIAEFAAEKILQHQQQLHI